MKGDFELFPGRLDGLTGRSGDGAEAGNAPTQHPPDATKQPPMSLTPPTTSAEGGHIHVDSCI